MSWTATWGYGIGVDSEGNVTVTGQTASSDFPTTSNAFQSSLHGASAAFVAQLSATGTLTYASYLRSRSSAPRYRQTLRPGHPAPLPASSRQTARASRRVARCLALSEG
jgi:hypothetical protein